MPGSPRLALAKDILARQRNSEGANLRGFGVIGSVAEGKDLRHSDLDLVVLQLRPRGPRVELREGVLVTYLRLTPQDARREVTEPSLEMFGRLAGWRSLRPMFDPSGSLRRVRALARRDPPQKQFDEAARLGLLGLYEDVGKFRNAMETRDRSREQEIRDMAMWFAGEAMGILYALRRHVPTDHRREFADLRRFGPLGRDIRRLRYDDLGLRGSSQLVEGIWTRLLAAARRRKIRLPAGLR